MTFVLELFAYRMGSGRLANLGIGADSPLCTRGRCGPDITENYNDAEEQKKITDDNSSTASSACWRDSSEAMPGAYQSYLHLRERASLTVRNHQLLHRLSVLRCSSLASSL